jgi:hypothetical protein
MLPARGIGAVAAAADNAHVGPLLQHTEIHGQCAGFP